MPLHLDLPAHGTGIDIGMAAARAELLCRYLRVAATLDVAGYSQTQHSISLIQSLIALNGIIDDLKLTSIETPDPVTVIFDRLNKRALGETV